MEEPIDGFWQERGRIFREIQTPLNEFILTKLKINQLSSKGIFEPALLDNIDVILKEMKSILINSGTEGDSYIRLEGSEMYCSPEDIARLNDAFERHLKGEITEQEYLKFRDSIPGTTKPKK